MNIFVIKGKNKRRGFIMLYISDMSRIKEGLYGITDTADNVLEYIPFEDVAKAIEEGRKVYGYTDKFKFTATPLSEDEVFYLGDCIAPPLSAIVGAFYTLKGKDILGKGTKDVLYNLFYLYEGKPCYSICRLYIPNDLLKKYVNKVYETDRLRMPSNVSDDMSVDFAIPRPIVLGKNGYASIDDSANTAVIESYFSCSLFVEVEVEVLTNVDKICSLCNISQNYFRLQVMNACNFCGDNRVGDIISLAVPTVSCNRYTDVAYPVRNRSTSVTKGDYSEEYVLKKFHHSAYTHIADSNSSELMDNYWSDFIDCAYGLLGYSFCQVLDYSGGTFRVDTDRKYLFGLKADCYKLEAFGGVQNERNAPPYNAMKELNKVFPNKAQYIQDMIDRYIGVSKTDYLIYTSIYGTYLVRDNVLEYIHKGGNTQLDSVKTKLKLFSSNVRITDISNRILKVTLVLEDGADEYVDLVGLSGTDRLGNIERFIIDFASDNAIPKSIKIVIPKGIKMIKFINGWKIYRIFDSMIEFETTSKTEIKGLLKLPEVFYFKNIIMNDVVKPYALKVMLTDVKYNTHSDKIISQILNENHTRFLFDIMHSAKDMTDKQKQSVYEKVKENLELFIENTCVRVSYSVSSNRTWNTVSILKVNHTDISNLSASGLVREDEELYYFKDGELNHHYYNKIYYNNMVKSDFSQNAVRAFIGALSNVIVTYMEVDPFIEAIAKLYVKYLRLITVMTNYIICSNSDGIGYSIKQNKFTVYRNYGSSDIRYKRTANDISFDW